MNSPLQYDVVIVGGGMVGAAIACALAPQELRIAVLDAHEARTDWQPDQPFDLRVSAITRASQRFLTAVGAWPNMVARRVHPYHDMRVWDATGQGQIHFDSAELAEPDLGHIIENSVIQAALVERMRDFANIHYFAPSKPVALHTDATHARLQLQDGRELHSKLLIGTDGARSWVRETLGIQTTGWPYGQKAVVCVVTTEHSHQDTCWQRFLPTGPLAFLPMAGNHSAIVWSTSHEQAEELLALDETDFLQRMTDALGDTPLGRVASTGKRAAFPLRLQHSHEYVRERVALAGDAAHAIHPLAGQGVNLGLLDAAALVEMISDRLQQGRDFGRRHNLRKYERARKSDNLLMMASMDGFKRLFSNDIRTLSLGRNLGLDAMDRLAPLKHEVIQHAMGLKGELPPLSRNPNQA
ncbi:MAG: UbiH/UbiF/VisC/COQ6 family ubiquinone biosynthesis hydroxylase [Gammaproteobacteria bacterium]|nr:UbiH/UbiF/VisC/COQ6 family ubiquinone biosynthesis hydroxylase [Gammaproteobacteria bacterium]